MISIVSSPPKVSLTVCAYMQERFIADAVQSALAQTGPALEIILSDDASKDRTFQIMQELAAAYRGPHRVALNRNPVNLGMIGHFNRLWELSTGELVVLQAGDDISVPDRAQKLVQRWEESNRKLDLLCSYFEEIDDQGRPTGYIKKEVVFVPDTSQNVSRWRCGATGACAAYARKLYSKYGPIDPKVAAEDWVYSFRAWLEGGIGLIEEPLVKHRTHAEACSVQARNVSQVPDRRTRFLRRRKMQAGAVAIAEEWLKAWRIAKDGSGREVERALVRLVEARKAELDAHDANLLTVWTILPRVLRYGGIKAALRTCVRNGLRVQ